MAIIKTEQTEFQGIPRKYLVESRDRPNSPRFFIGYNKGIPFISDEIQNHYRPFMVLHELFEFEIARPNNLDSPCLEALKFELKSVPEGMRDSYDKFRLLTFKELIWYLENHNTNPDFISQVQESKNYLESLVGQ